MSDKTSSVDPFIDDITDDMMDESESDVVHLAVNKTLDSRRRLEEKLAQRSLEKDVREFDFDFDHY